MHKNTHTHTLTYVLYTQTHVRIHTLVFVTWEGIALTHIHSQETYAELYHNYYMTDINLKLNLTLILG